jgi:glucose/arabinose dehydrogenase
MNVCRRALGALLAGTVVVGTSAAPARAARAAPEVSVRRVSSLPEATALAIRAGDRTLYVTQQDGHVRAIRDDKLVDRPVLDLSGDTVSSGERGLLGLAFSPDGQYLYVDYTDRSGDTHIDQFTMKGAVADPSSRRSILFVEQPQPNHNGGQLAFGPDGYLYIAFGDGGAAGDEGPGHVKGGNGQSLRTMLGKILRVDPTPEGPEPYVVPQDNPFVGRSRAKPEIWSYGLRNPWRFSFDPDTGDLWIGDVGQNAWEEIDFVRANNGHGAGRGEDFGWNLREGLHEYRGRAPSGAVEPVYEVSHDDGACSITGGFVYRGAAIDSLRGKYVFTDYCDGRLLALSPSGNGAFRAEDLGVTLPSVSSFGQGPDRELYVLSQERGIYEIVAP